MDICFNTRGGVAQCLTGLTSDWWMSVMRCANPTKASRYVLETETERSLPSSGWSFEGDFTIEIKLINTKGLVHRTKYRDILRIVIWV